MSITPTELVRRRTRLGLSQEAMVERLDLSRRMYQYYEAGEYTIPRTVALATEALLWRSHGCEKCQDRVEGLGTPNQMETDT